MNRDSDIKGSVTKGFEQLEHGFYTFVLEIFNSSVKGTVAIKYNAQVLHFFDDFQFLIINVKTFILYNSTRTVENDNLGFLNIYS